MVGAPFKRDLVARDRNASGLGAILLKITISALRAGGHNPLGLRLGNVDRHQAAVFAVMGEVRNLVKVIHPTANDDLRFKSALAVRFVSAAQNSSLLDIFPTVCAAGRFCASPFLHFGIVNGGLAPGFPPGRTLSGHDA